MIIPDMLKNAPMFKRLDAKIRVRHHLLHCTGSLFGLTCEVKGLVYFCRAKAQQALELDVDVLQPFERR